MTGNLILLILKFYTWNNYGFKIQDGYISPYIRRGRICGNFIGHSLYGAGNNGRYSKRAFRIRRCVRDVCIGRLYRILVEMDGGKNK
jgi:hypothetical protein